MAESYILDVGDDWQGEANVLLLGEGGFGILAENIPSSGDFGPPYLYNDVTLPADNGKEICGRITIFPVGLTSFRVFDDSSFIPVGPNGNYSFTYQKYVDGVIDGGTAVASFTIGADVALAGAAISVASGFGQIISSIVLSGSATINTQMGGDPTFTISLNGVILQQQIAQATLSGDGSLSANATQQSSAAADLTVMIALAGSSIAQALAVANLSVGGGLEGSAQQQSGVTGSVITRIDISGTPQAYVTGAGNLSTMLPISGATLQVNSVTGQLTAAITVRANALQQALSTGDLTVRIAAVGAALQQALLAGTLDALEKIIDNNWLVRPRLRSYKAKRFTG